MYSGILFIIHFQCSSINVSNLKTKNGIAPNPICFQKRVLILELYIFS